MKLVTVLATACFFVGGSAIVQVSPAKAKCSDASLAANFTTIFTGTYGNGTGETPVNFALAGLMNFNGAGTVSLAFSDSVNGVLESSTATGTYSIDAHCAGSLTVAGITASIFVNGAGFTGLVTMDGWAVTIAGTGAPP